jgi:pimeloyl-ACP methyl ester carboxylesterase
MSNFVLLRGLARETRHWGDFIPVLQQKFPTAEIELIDLAGNGTEVNRDSFSIVQGFTEDLRRRSKLIQQKRKPILIAVSLGGMIAADWSNRYPKELSGTVLINTSDGGSAAFYQRLRPTAMLKMIKMATVTHDQRLLELKALELTCNKPENYDRYLEIFAQAPRPKVGNFLKQIFSASRFRFAKTCPALPILVLASRGDRMVSYKCGEKIAAQWQVPIQLHETAGHDLSLDEPDWVAEQIKLWLPKSQ